MAGKISPIAFLNRGTAGMSADAVIFLMENKDEYKAFCEFLDARRKAALDAIAEAEAKLKADGERAAELADRERELGELEADLARRETAVALGETALAAELDEREAKFAALEADLERRQKAVAKDKKARLDFVAWYRANPLPVLPDMKEH